MKTELKGYRDAAGSGKAETICDENVAQAEQIRIFQNAKVNHVFPKGIKRLDLCVVDVRDTAIFMGQEVASGISTLNEALEKAEAEKKSRHEAHTKAANELAAAKKKVQDTAKARNELLGKLHIAEANLRNARIGQEKMPSPLHEAALAAAQKALMGDPEKKVASLADQVEAAKKAYDEAFAELQKLTKPTPK